MRAIAALIAGLTAERSIWTSSLAQGPKFADSRLEETGFELLIRGRGEQPEPCWLLTHGWITAENVNDLLTGSGGAGEVHLFSLDSGCVESAPLFCDTAKTDSLAV